VKVIGIPFWLMLSLTLALLPKGLAAMPGSLDANFNPPLVAAPNNPGAAVYVVALQSDGQILIGGLFFAVSDTNLLVNVARLNPDGSIDPSFLPGRVADTGYVDALAVQPDGKIVVGGSFYSSRGGAPVNLLRLNADGTVDSGFFRFSYVDGPVNAVLLQSDGKILIGAALQSWMAWCVKVWPGSMPMAPSIPASTLVSPRPRVQAARHWRCKTTAKSWRAARLFSIPDYSAMESPV